MRPASAARASNHASLAALIALAVFTAAVIVVAVGTLMREPSGANAASRGGSAVHNQPTDPFTAAAIRRYLSHRAGDITACAYDVDSHTLYVYRPDVRETTASIMKVDILATLLHQAQSNGGLLGTPQGALAEEMIEDSDNDDAQDLWDEEGGSAAVGDFDDDAHMDETAPNPDGYWGLSTTTARDQVALLQHVLLPNALLDPVSRGYEHRLMLDVTPSQRWGVSAGVGPGAHVALKNGWLPLAQGDWQVNSIGAVVGSGRHYFIAVLTTGDPTEGYGIRTIEHISAAAWHALA